jgi:hypothetical protein
VIVEFHDNPVTLEARPSKEAAAFSYVRDGKLNPAGDQIAGFLLIRKGAERFAVAVSAIALFVLRVGCILI